jgi:hypothetical protein
MTVTYLPEVVKMTQKLYEDLLQRKRFVACLMENFGSCVIDFQCTLTGA